MEADLNCLILGYLKDHDFKRTAKEFEFESRYSKRGIMTNHLIGKEYLMPSLGQIVQDYCAMKKVEKELIRKSHSFCIISLWRQFDALINQLKLLTIGRQANQPGRTSSSRSVSNAYYARVSAEVSSHIGSDFSQVSQSQTVRTSTVPTSSHENEEIEPNSKEPVSKFQESTNKSKGIVVASDVSHEAEGTPPGQNTYLEGSSASHDDSGPTDENYEELAESSFHSHNKIANVDTVKGDFSRSPKRKRIRPKKLENIGHSFPDSELQNIDYQLQQRKDDHTMVQQASNPNQANSSTSELNAIFDALLSSKSLQEKIADNINKVATR